MDVTGIIGFEIKEGKLTKHRLSPRPWKLDRDYIRDARGNIIAKLYHHDQESKAERKRSFRYGLLMSKAPELLAALKAATESLDNWVELQDEEDARDYDAMALSTAHDLIDKLEGKYAKTNTTQRTKNIC